MRLLDLYCGAGGATYGYHLAGFDDITGIDNRPQPRYPFRFVQADALEYLKAHGHEYDVIHASPPCQAYTAIRTLRRLEYPETIEPLRPILLASGVPYIIENVPGAPLINPIMLCGLMFNLNVFRHRLFESSQFMLAPVHRPHRELEKQSQGCNGINNRISDSGIITVAGHFSNTEYAREAMGIDWMTRDELAQAIPPAYTHWIGTQLMQHLARKAVL